MGSDRSSAGRRWAVINAANGQERSVNLGGFDHDQPLKVDRCLVKSMQLRSYAIPQLLMTNQLGQFSISPDTLPTKRGSACIYRLSVLTLLWSGFQKRECHPALSFGSSF